jgi:amino acid transporter
MASTVQQGPQGPSLARGAIGLREVLFQSVTHMAPAAAVAFSIPAGAAYAGGALPLATVLALVASVFVALSIGQLARHLPSAGSFYTYTAKGIHPWIGFLVAWAYAFAEAFIAAFLFLVFAITLSGTLNTEYGVSTGTWWIWVLGASVVILILGYFGVRVSTRTGTVLGAFEIAVFGALAIWLIVEAGSANTITVFGTSHANVSGYAGLSGVFAASVYSVLAFTGFESAAPLAEETRDPRKTIGRAVILSAAAIGAFYVLTTYAAAVFQGPNNMADFASLNNGDPWTMLARSVWGVGWVLAFLAILNSAIANANAGANATTRTWFAMGRIRLLPAFMAMVHPRWKSPHVAVLIQFAVAVGLALWLGFQYTPYTAFIFMATMFTLVLIALYILIQLACILYFWRFQRHEANWFMHGLIPVLGIAAFVPAFLTAGGIRVFKFVAPLSYPVSLSGIVVGVWMVLGIIYLVYLQSRHPDRIEQTERIFYDEPSAVAADPESKAAGGETVS